MNPRRTLPSRSERIPWTEEQRMRTAGAVLASLVAPNMGDEDLREAAELSWKATAALEATAPRNGGRR